MASAPISVGSASTATIVAAPGAGKFIRVLGYQIVPTSGTTPSVQWQDSNGPTALTGVMVASIGNDINPGYATDGWFDVSVNGALNLVVGGTTPVVAGHVRYEIKG